MSASYETQLDKLYPYQKAMIDAIMHKPSPLLKVTYKHQGIHCHRIEFGRWNSKTNRFDPIRLRGSKGWRKHLRREKARHD